jgi:hypothetical protein
MEFMEGQFCGIQNLAEGMSNAERRAIYLEMNQVVCTSLWRTMDGLATYGKAGSSYFEHESLGGASNTLRRLMGLAR